MGKHYGLDIPTLSELRIDVDKEWVDENGQPRGITKLKEVANAMARGDLGVRDTFVLVRLPPGPIGYKLTSAGPLKIPSWAPPGSELEYWFPVWLDLAHSAEIVEPQTQEKQAPLVSPYGLSGIAQEVNPDWFRNLTPTISLSRSVGVITPDHSVDKNIPAATGYQAEAHVASAFGHFSIGANNISIVNMIRGSRFVLTEGGTAQSICAYIQITGVGPTVHVKAGIYDRNLGLVGETDQLSLSPGAAAWQTFPFTTPPTLAANIEYWLVIWGESVADSDALIWYDTADGVGIDQGLYYSQTYNTLPASILGATLEQRKYSVYCNYT